MRPVLQAKGLKIREGSAFEGVSSFLARRFQGKAELIYRERGRFLAACFAPCIGLLALGFAGLGAVGGASLRR